MHVVMNATLKPDGTLELDARPLVEPGRVRVTIEDVSPVQAKLDALQVFEEIVAEQDQACGCRRTAAEIDAQIECFDKEWEERQLELERLQEECRQARGRNK